MALSSFKFQRTYDPLTLGSYRNPYAPWVGINRGEDEKEDLSPAIARLERLMREYIERQVASSSILIGGDRGAGKTSLVKKVVERVRRPKGDPPNAETAYHLYWTFPRPLLVRVHGRRCLSFELNETGIDDSQNLTGVLRLIAEAVHRALVDEFGRVFTSLAQERSIEEQEEAAQVKMELDEGPSPARLQEMWTLFSTDGQPVPKLPRLTADKAVPKDQAVREITAMASSIQLIREIRRQQKEEAERNGNGSLADAQHARATRDEVGFWKEFASQMLDGGRLVNPLAGFMVTALVFIAVLKAEVPLPLAILIGLLSGLATTVLLNYATARRHNSAMLADARLASIDRTLPVLLRRMEHAGIFPVIVVDELDKLESETGIIHSKATTLRTPAMPDSFERRMDSLIRNLKYFFADESFVCFLVGRGYYDRVLQNAHKRTSDRTHVDTFFADRILVSHTAESLMRYLNALIPPAGDEETIRTQTFLKYLYLYRAKGHLSDLQEAIAADHQVDYGVMLKTEIPVTDVAEYRQQVLYQLSVHYVLDSPAVQVVLRQKPDLLQSFNTILYEPARLWENSERFVHSEQICRLVSDYREAYNVFRTPLDNLLWKLSRPWELWADKPGSNLLQRDLERLKPVFNPDADKKNPAALVRHDDVFGTKLYYFNNPMYQNVPWSKEPEYALAGGDCDIEEVDAAIESVQDVVRDLFGPNVTIRDICSINTLPQETSWLIDYTFCSVEPGRSTWEGKRERQTLYRAMVQRCEPLRAVLLLGTMQLSHGQQHLTVESFRSALHEIAANANDTQTMIHAIDKQITEFENSRPHLSTEFRLALNRAVVDARNFRGWCRELHFLARKLRALQ